MATWGGGLKFGWDFTWKFSKSRHSMTDFLGMKFHPKPRSIIPKTPPKIQQEKQTPIFYRKKPTSKKTTERRTDIEWSKFITSYSFLILEPKGTSKVDSAKKIYKRNWKHQKKTYIIQIRCYITKKRSPYKFE